jgi:hypothetical protein
MGMELPKISADYGAGFADSILIDGRKLTVSYPGQIFWVDENAQRKGRGTFKSPDAAIDDAYNRCVTTRGDIVMVKPGHVENITTKDDSQLILDKASVALVGLGRGDNQAEINIAAGTTTTSNHIAITGVSNTVAGFRIENAVDDTVTMFDVDGNNTLFSDNLFICGTALGPAQTINIGDQCDYFKFMDNRVDYTLDDDGVSFAFCEGSNYGIQVGRNSIDGLFTTGAWDLDASTYLGQFLFHDNFMYNRDTTVGMTVLINAAVVGFFVRDMHANGLNATEPIDDFTASFFLETYATDQPSSYGIVMGTTSAF